jgi:hypothetical protein
MHHDIQKTIFYHNLNLFFPIWDRKDLKKIFTFEKIPNFSENSPSDG